MCKVGDKFIIEIGGEYPENPFENGENGKAPTILYKIKGFNSLVFDEKGLDRLEKAENLERLAYDRGYSKAENDYFKQTEVDAENTMQAGYEKGLSDAWDCIRKIKDNDILTNQEIFEVDYQREIIDKCTPQEAIEKLKTWEEKQEIKVGDVIISSEGNKAVIQFITPNGEWECFNKHTYFILNKEKQKLWKKTGKHIDLTEIFNGLEEKDADSD